MVHLTNIPITFFANKSNYFFYKSDVGFEIWAILLFVASFDHSNLRGQVENLKFYCGFLCGKREDFGVILSESINFDYLRH